MLQRTRLFDLQLINDKNFDATIASILSFNTEFNPESQALPMLFTPNVDDVVKLNEKKYADLASVLRRSFYILPDGQPIIWVSKLFKGKKLGRRLPGSELFPLLWAEILRSNKRVMLVAPSKEVGELHRNGDYHIHDLDMFSGYCAGWSLRQLLELGFNGLPNRLESAPPKNLQSVVNQMINFL